MAIRNPSAPPFSVIPVLTYDDVPAAVEWLARVFGFAERVRIGDHRAQLSAGGGAVIVADSSSGRGAPAAGGATTHSVMIRVDDVHAHHSACVAAGAEVIAEPVDHPYGERQYSVRDPWGHRWSFTQSVAATEPESWGGVTVHPW